MQKRRPITPEHKIKDEKKSETPSPRRKGKEPYQERISVEDIPTNSSLEEFISMENDEMRRIQLRLEQAEDKESPGGGGVGGGGSPKKLTKVTTSGGGGGEGSGWALTAEHNDEIVSKMVVQDEDFIDTGKIRQKYDLGLVWNLTEHDLEDILSTFPEATRVKIKAWAYTNPAQFLDWLRLGLRPIKSITGQEWPQPGNWYYTINLVNDEWSPSPNKYYGTDSMGSKGFHEFTAVTGGVLEYVLNYADVESVITIGAIPAGKTVQTAMLEVTSGFDVGIAEIGDDGLYNRLMKVTENDLEVINKYHNYPDYKYSTTTDIKLRFYGGVPTAGELRILIYYH